MVYLTHGQAAGIYAAKRGILNREISIEDAEFGAKEQGNYKSASTFAGFVESNRINLVEGNNGKLHRAS